MWKLKLTKRKEDEFEVKSREIDRTLSRLPTLSRFETLGTIKSQMQVFFKIAQDNLDHTLQSSVDVSKYIAKPERVEFLKSIEHLVGISIKDYIEKDIQDPVVSLKQFVSSYIKTKTGDTPSLVLKAHVLKIMEKCSTRGHSHGKGIQFSYKLPKTVNVQPSRLYQTFSKELIYDLEPTSYVYLSLYVLGGELQFWPKRGGWSCG